MAKTYYGYAQREVAEGVDWSGVARKFTNMLEDEVKLREERQGALDKADSDLATLLQTSPNGQTEELHNYMLDFANNASNYQLMLKRSVDAGNMSRKQYTQGINNLMAGTNQAITMVNKYNEVLKNREEKIKNGTMSAKMLYETELIQGFNDFSNTALYIDPITFKVSQGKTVTKNGVRTMSSNTGDFRPISTMLSWMGEDYDKFDMSAAVTDIAGNMATTYEQIVNKGGEGEVDDVRLNAQYEKALDNYVNSYIADPRNVASILADYSGVSPDGVAWEFTTDKNLKDKENFIYIQPNKKGGYDIDLDSKHGKRLQELAGEYLKASVDVKLPRKVSAQTTSGKFDNDYAAYVSELSMDTRSAANWMTLQNAENLEQWTSAKNFWLGKQIKSGNDFVTIADIKINDNNDGIELVINQKEGGQKTIPASFGSNQAWLNQGAGGVLQGINVDGISVSKPFQPFMAGSRAIGENNVPVNWSTQGVTNQGINYENLEVVTKGGGTEDEQVGSALDLINVTTYDSADDVISVVNTIFNSTPANNRQMLSDVSLSPVEFKGTEYAEIYYPAFMSAPIYINSEEVNPNTLNAIMKQLYDASAKQEFLRPNDFKGVLGDEWVNQETIMTDRIKKGEIPKSGRNQNPVTWNGGDGRLEITNRIQKENPLVPKDIEIAGYVIGEKPNPQKIKEANPNSSFTEIINLVKQAEELYKLYGNK